jgi:hypothetical protein
MQRNLTPNNSRLCERKFVIFWRPDTGMEYAGSVYVCAIRQMQGGPGQTLAN